MPTANTRVTQGILDILFEEGIITSKTPAQGQWVGSEGQIPTPDTNISALPVGGRDPNPAWPFDYPHVQLIIRAPEGDFAQGYSKAWEVRTALLGKANFMRGNDQWASIRLLGDINFIGYDSNMRPMFSINLELIIHVADLGNRREVI